jgi:CheY-like chemotaxis protein
VGYLTLEAECGEQALALLAASEDIGMLISDLMLPGQMSGAEVINLPVSTTRICRCY